MSGKIKFTLVSLYVIGFGLLLKYLTIGKNMGILDPKGVMARQEKELIIMAVLLMLIVVIPVFIMTIAFTWKYRADNTNAKYTPTVDHNTLEEFIWWAIPCAIILVLATITWKSSHELDPYRPLVSDVKPIEIQVVALNWKWLFIYPEEGIATVGYVEFPVNTPVNFHITADAPMNSFWMPQLAGQVYAMAGMDTQLHVMADQVGVYRGVSSNFSGDGFSGMRFDAHAVSTSDFNQWNIAAHQGTLSLTESTYQQLVEPSSPKAIETYSAVDSGLYNNIITKYMMQTQKSVVIATSSIPNIPRMIMDTDDMEQTSIIRM